MICPECDRTEGHELQADGSAQCLCGARFAPYIRCWGCGELFPRGGTRPTDPGQYCSKECEESAPDLEELL